MITSLHNDRVKLVHALQTAAKARRKEHSVALEGVRLIRDALAQGYTPDFILYDPDLVTETEIVGAQYALPVSPEVMRHISETEQPPGVIGVFPMPDTRLPQTPTCVLILDDMRDPGNLGTILRTAAAAGVEAVLLSPKTVDPYNPKALRGGMGAHFRIPLAERDWGAIRAYCDGLHIYLADMTGDVSYNAANWSHPWALIIGSEAHGDSAEAAGLAHQRVYIPMSGDTESLNAAVAAGVILFEARRRK
jgi:RNA methyltransferase, TrmH family